MSHRGFWFDIMLIIRSNEETLTVTSRIREMMK